MRANVKRLLTSCQEMHLSALLNCTFVAACEACFEVDPDGYGLGLEVSGRIKDAPGQAAPSTSFRSRAAQRGSVRPAVTSAFSQVPEASRRPFLQSRALSFASAAAATD